MGDLADALRKAQEIMAKRQRPAKNYAVWLGNDPKPDATGKAGIIHIRFVDKLPGEPMHEVEV